MSPLTALGMSTGGRGSAGLVSSGVWGRESIRPPDMGVQPAYSVRSVSSTVHRDQCQYTVSSDKGHSAYPDQLGPRRYAKESRDPRAAERSGASRRRYDSGSNCDGCALLSAALWHASNDSRKGETTEFSPERTVLSTPPLWMSRSRSVRHGKPSCKARRMASVQTRSRSVSI